MTPWQRQQQMLHQKYKEEFRVDFIYQVDREIVCGKYKLMFPDAFRHVLMMSILKEMNRC